MASVIPVLRTYSCGLPLKLLAPPPRRPPPPWAKCFSLSRPTPLVKRDHSPPRLTANMESTEGRPLYLRFLPRQLEIMIYYVASPVQCLFLLRNEPEISVTLFHIVPAGFPSSLACQPRPAPAPGRTHAPHACSAAGSLSIWSLYPLPHASRASPLARTICSSLLFRQA